MKTKTRLLIFFLCLISLRASSQEKEFRVIDQTNSIRLLQVRPNLSLGILPEYIGDLAVQLNVDAQYWIKDKMDVRLSLLSGSFTGVMLGGTLHTSDVRKSKTFKFIVSESEQDGKRYTEYYNQPAQIRVVKGLTGDVKFALTDMGETPKGFFTQIRAGLDFQYFSRSYLEVGDETYPNNKNGWFSIKMMGIFQYYKKAENSEMEFGAVGSMTAVKSPWKGVTMNLNLDMGLTFGSEGITPIISPGFGLSINLINSKEPIEY